MAEAAAAVGADGSDAKHERTVYAAGGGRKLFFSFLFLILLPFYLSIPAMVVMRVRHGLYFDAIGLGIVATAFTILMVLIVIELDPCARCVRRGVGEDDAAVGTRPHAHAVLPQLRHPL